ncbi:MAG: flagellar biosynthesis protein FlgL [Bradyrhizobium sp.]
MGVSGIGGSSAAALLSITTMKSQLDDLQRQLGTGKKADSYAGLGLDRGLTVGLRSQLSAISGFQDTITQVGVRLDLMQTALTQFDSVTQQTKSSILQSQFVLPGTNQTQDQVNALGQLNQLVGLLNTGADGRYLFSGRSVDQIPVQDTDKIINGDGVRAGLKQVIDERRQADLGASGLGRLAVGSAGTAVSLTADASPFGFKLVGATTAISGATVTAPSGSPASMAVDLGATNPSDGDSIKFTFTLPDGSSRDLTLTATTASPPGAGQFSIGANSTATAANLQAALTQNIGTLANTELVAASALAAGNDFFDTDASHPPQRVDGPPFATATGLVDGTAANTVSWYLGDNATDDPRSTAIARVDQSLPVSYGVRANEQALSTAVKTMAVFSAMTFSSSDPNAADQYSALRQRVGAALTSAPNQQQVSDIAGQLAGAQVALSNAKDRHDQANTTLQNLLDSVEGAPTEQVAAQILQLQTSLQGTLQVTAMLLQNTLLKYL